jgi:hypothetical protein
MVWLALVWNWFADGKNVVLVACFCVMHGICSMTECFFNHQQAWLNRLYNAAWQCFFGFANSDQFLSWSTSN